MLFTRLAVAIAVVVTLAAVVAGQTEPSVSASTNTKTEAKTDKTNGNKSEQPAKESKPPFTLSVTDDQIIGISLKARDASLKDIAAELSRRLRIPVAVTPIMQKHPVTTNFSDLVLEPAMQQLAPQVFIDYEIDTTPGKAPRPLGIYLQGYNEAPPAENAVVRGNSDVMVIEGDTEDTGTDPKEKEEQELNIKYEKGLLTVKARKQPLVVVLYAIANELSVPLEVRNEVADPVTVSISQTSIDSALQQLGPNIRLYLRANLQTQERRPLRMVLVGPEKKS
ncbi:MAG TPA: hypothetical protein VIF81_12155 [Pyrinomonadaceae bacterium]